MGGIIRGAGGGGGDKQHTPIESPDSLHSIALARILDIVSEGEINGFPDRLNPMSCVFYNETPVCNADGSVNFKNVTIDSRMGTQNQDYIKGFEGVENETGVGVELTYGTPWTHTFTNLDLSAVRIRLSTPALSEQTSNGDIKGYVVDYQIELSVDGGSFIVKLPGSFNGKTSSKYERTHRIDLPPATTNWTIRVVRLTPNSLLASIQNTTVVESYAEIIDVKLRMPMTALVSTIIDAKQFNNIPNRAFLLEGRIISVPSNYDPVTRIYTGIWDGTFQPRYSNNPAWVFYDIALNEVYGLGHLVSPELVDKWSLYAIGVYCDGMVSDGRGGLEPRFQADLYLQVQADATKVIQDMATMFRGIVYAAGGALTAVSDMPADVCYTYTPSNVVDGKFVYQGSSRKVRHTVALVSWNDRDDFSRAKVEYVQDEPGIARYGVQPTEVIAVGCTSRSQAHRMGKHILLTERLETDAVAFAVGLDGCIPAPGKIIAIADPLRARVRNGGRIVHGYSDSILIDYMPPLNIGDRVSVILPTGMPEKRIVSNVYDRTIVVDTPFTQVPMRDSVWLIESDEVAAQLFKVIGIFESNDKLGYAINAIQHVEGKNEFVENDIAIDLPPISSMLGKPDAPPVVVLTNFLRVGHGTAFNVLNADWDSMPNATAYDVQWQKDDGSWSAPRRKGDSSDEFEGAFAGTYRCRVWSVNSRSFSRTVVSNSITITDALIPIYDLEIVGGIVIIDCRFSQFRLILTENVTGAVFTNVAPQDTLLIELTQTGSFTAYFGPSVSPISGIPYVATPVAGAIDNIGLSTNNSGAVWQMAVQQPLAEVPGGGGSAGAPGVAISPSPASATTSTDGTTASQPSVTVTATVTGGTAGFVHAWTRADTAGGTDFTIDNPAIDAPTFSIPSGVTNYAPTMQTWRDVVTDAATLTGVATVNITLARTLGLPLYAPGIIKSGSTVYGHSITITANSTAVVNFGTGPYTYSWAAVGTIFGVTVSGQATATLNISMTGSSNRTSTGNFDLTVTDALSVSKTYRVAFDLEIADDR